MAGPWEDYQKPDTGKPWEDFKSAAAPTEQPTEAKPPEQQSSWLGSVAHGFVDPLVGAAQFISHIPRPFDVMPERYRKVDEAGKAQLDEFVRSREQSIEKERGPKAGYDWWRLAGNLLNPINYYAPIKAAAGAGIAERAGAAALQGATVGAMQPASTGGSYAGEKAIQMGSGALVGTAVEPLISAGGAAMKWLAGTKGTEALADKATQKIIARIDQSGATAQDMLDLIATAPGKPLALADVGGENLQGMVGRIYREPGEARDIIGKALRERDLNAGLRLAEDVNTAIGAGSVHDTGQALAAARAAAARPKYQAAFDRIVVTDDEAAAVAHFIRDPIGQDALQRGMRVIELEHLAEGKNFVPADFGVARDETGKFALLSDYTNLRLMDAVKRGYDEIVEDFRNQTTGRLEPTQYGRAVNLVRAAYTKTLREMYPRYAGALDAWSGPSRSIGAMKAGEGLLSRSPEEIAQRLKDLTPNDREFYKLGAAATLRKKLATTGVSADEAKRIAGTQYIRDQLRPLFESDAAYDQFINSVLAEQTMYGTKQSVMGGSQTAAREAEDHGPDPSDLAHGAYAAASALHGGFWPSTFYHGGRALKALGLGKPNPALNAAIAKQAVDPREAARILGIMQSRPPPSRTLSQSLAPWAVPGAVVATEPRR